MALNTLVDGACAARPSSGNITTMSDWEALETRTGLTPVPASQIKVGHERRFFGTVTATRTSASGSTCWITVESRSGKSRTERISATANVIITNWGAV
jgi:hypothetical protein